MKLDQRYARVRKCLEQVHEGSRPSAGTEETASSSSYDFALDGSALNCVLACIKLAIQPLDLAVQGYPDRRYDLQTSVLKDIGVRMIRLPLEDDAIALNQELFDLRSKQPDHGREPIIERPRRMIEIDDKSIEHPDDVGCSVPALSGDPAIGREQPLRHSCRGH